MPDDLIMLGGPERRSRREADESVEALFHAHYPRIVSSTFGRVGDWDLAEQLALKAYLRLRRNRRLVGDPQAALQYLQRLPAKRAAGAGRLVRAMAGRPGSRTGSPDGAAARTGGRVIDTVRAWREFEELRARSAVRRRRALTASGSAILAALVIMVPLLISSHSVRQIPQHGVRLNAPAQPRAYQRAIVARFELSGVISVVGDATMAWAMRANTQPATIEQPAAATNYQLVAMDLRSNTIVYRLNLGRHARAIAAGAGWVWMTTPTSQAGGQIARIDPAIGLVVQKVHLRAGRCGQLGFSSGLLFAACSATPAGTGLWMINPRNGRGSLLGGPVDGGITSLVAAPDAVWYIRGFVSVGGVTQFTGRAITIVPKHVTARAPGLRDTAPGGVGLVYDAGSVWALGSQERLYRINAVTGKVVRTFTYRDYDPARIGWVNFLTAGGGWLWFLNNGYPFSGVVRVSEATGRLAGGVAIAPNACGQQVCSQIFYTPGSVWVPTAGLLIRIDPGRLPAAYERRLGG